ncbi:alpha/beta hydrolase family protein [Portibacter marinus]|uniref:alpha/beta hydrolase family protein n=1 Tax=Portibacter marinus TaxID=2898660 RepID=UPI001F370460|nr:alpha/beta hydrolase [Portibacter marinus]
MKDRMLTLLLLIIAVLGLRAQSIVGDWEGDLEVQGTTLKIIFHITEEDGIYVSTLDSPNQGAFDIEMDETTYEDGKLVIKNKKMSMETTATYLASEDKITGSFNQGPMKLPLELTRKSKIDTRLPVSNHPIAGSWHTSLDAMGTQLRLIFHIAEEKGDFSSTMDSPDQGAFGIETSETNIDGNKINITAKNMGITLDGTYVPDSNIINARFRQGPLNQKIVLKREAIDKKELKRPQEPKVFDYRMEDVKFTNPAGGHELAGTLTLPLSGNYDKAVVLVSGSGPQDRNEELLGHKPFLVLSDYLTRNGVAVLRYDDRGVGESTGNFESATSMDLAMDAKFAVEYLRSREEMKDVKIGIMGHSEGGLIAPIVADKTALDFIVMLAGPGIDSDELLLEQITAISQASDGDPEEVNFSVESSREVFAFIKENQELSDEDLRSGIEKILRERFQLLSEEDLEEIGDVDAEIASQVKSVSNPWFRYFISFEPEVYLSKLSIPVLAVNGSLDLQVLSKSNLEGIMQNLEKAGNKNFTVKEFEGLNHLFQVSKDGTGSPNEYGALEETFNEEVIAFVTDWILKFDRK